jgi:hypothetical protein
VSQDASAQLLGGLCRHMGGKSLDPAACRTGWHHTWGALACWGSLLLGASSRACLRCRSPCRPAAVTDTTGFSAELPALLHAGATTRTPYAPKHAVYVVPKLLLLLAAWPPGLRWQHHAPPQPHPGHGQANVWQPVICVCARRGEYFRQILPAAIGGQVSWTPVWTRQICNSSTLSARWVAGTC